LRSLSLAARRPVGRLAKSAISFSSATVVFRRVLPDLRLRSRVMAVFRLRYGPREVVLPLGKFTIGRASDCTLRIEDEWLSRHHAVLRVETDKVAIRDAGSRNGVIVNGVRIRSAHYLQPGDRIRLGRHELELLR